MADQNYLVDSDVLITAKNLYYAFDICPGFWEFLLYHHRKDRVFSIEPVRKELLRGKDELGQWVKSKVPKDFFRPVDTDEVKNEYAQIEAWVNNHKNYRDHAKSRYSKSADGWLVAYSKAHATTVVTNERSEPNSRKNVKLPDVCLEFQVDYRNTFGMLRELGAQYDWAGENE